MQADHVCYWPVSRTLADILAGEEVEYCNGNQRNVSVYVEFTVPGNRWILFFIARDLYVGEG